MGNNTDTLNEKRIENVNLKGLTTEFLVVVGETEVLYEEVMQFKQRCQTEFGLKWNQITEHHNIHDWPFLIGVFPEAKQTMNQIAQFVHEKWFE